MGYDMYIIRKDPDEEAEVAKARDAFEQAVKERDALPREWAGQFTEDELRALVASGKGVWNAAPANRHPKFAEAQAKVDMTYDLMFATEKSYFRLNIRGMGAAVSVMADLGVLRTDYRTPPWPKLGPWMREGQPEPVDMDQWYWAWLEEPQYRPEDYQEPPAEVEAAFKDFKAKLAAHRRWSPEPEFPDDARIPAHKFSSNDAWVVTEEECAYAHRVLSAARESGAAYVKALTRHGWKGDNGRRVIDNWIDFLHRASTRGGFEVR